MVLYKYNVVLLEIYMKKRYTNEFVDLLLVNRNIVRNDDYINSSTPIEWKCCLCHHTWKTTPTKILRTKTNCPSCSYSNRGLKRRSTNFAIDQAIVHLNIVRLEDIVMGTKPILWKCLNCSHQWMNSPTHLLRTKIGCPVCERKFQIKRNKSKAYTNEKIDLLLNNKDRNMLRVGDYLNMLTKIEWRCLKCEQNWFARPNDILNNNSGCPMCTHHSYSKVAIRWLEAIMEEYHIHIQHAENGGEYNIPGTRIKVDGYCKENNTVYEFHGDCYHGNPRIFKRDEQCHPWSQKPAGELYDQTLKREKIIKNMGYNLVTMWEQDYQVSVKLLLHHFS